MLGDSYGAGIVERLSKADLERFDQEHHQLEGSDRTGSTDDLPLKEKGGGLNNPVFVDSVEIKVGERL